MMSLAHFSIFPHIYHVEFTPVFHYIVLPLGHHFTRRPNGRLVSKFLQGVVVVYDTLDKGLLEICIPSV